MIHAGIRRALFFVFLSATLVLPAAYSADTIPWQWSGVGKIIVIGDLHGDYEKFISILKGTQVIDRDLHWAAGKAHFVQMGDVMDRGYYAKNILDDMMRLEKEAEAAGGMVHILLGNHEELNLTGIVFSSNIDYVTLDQFMSFLPEGYRKKQEEALAKKVFKALERDRDTRPKDVIDEFWNSLRDNPSVQRIYSLNFNEVYGPWLRRQNVAIKINDVVFVHGGISEKYAKWGIQEINDRYREELANIWREFKGAEPPSGFRPSNVTPSIVYRGDSPLWYRELANVPEEDLRDELDTILETLGAKEMVIAHTPRIARNPRDMQRFGGKVWIVDTGISKVYGGPPSALIIEEGYFTVWGVGDENDNRSHRSYLDLDHIGSGHPAGVPTGRSGNQPDGSPGEGSSRSPNREYRERKAGRENRPLACHSQ
jgi:Calcineurin-like phosphoesterase